MLGLKRGTVTLCDHCAEWETEASKIISRLKERFGDLAYDIQHIGSTSIKFIKAKPILDIAIGVKTFENLEDCQTPLLNMGIYKSPGQPFPNIVLFSMDDKQGNRICNLQVVMYGSEQWNKHILFRDYMNSCPEKAAAYDRIKKEAAALFPNDVSAYSEYKSTFINACIEEAKKARKYYQAYEDRYQAAHEKNLRCMGYEPSSIVAETLRKYGVTKNQKLLEIGCGEGRDAIVLLENGYDLLATDVSPHAVTYCREQYKAYADHFTVLDAVCETHKHKYDFIYSVAVIHMLVPDEDRKAFYTFVGEHLTEDGIALICTMGDGEIERMTDISKAFDKTERIFEGNTMLVAETSCRIVTFDTFCSELQNANLALLEKGITSVGTQFPVMMYAIVKLR